MRIDNYLYFISGGIVVAIFYITGYLIKSIKIRRRFIRGIKEEKKAEKFLEKNGYKICGYQEVNKYNLKSGDETYNIEIKPDYIVEKNGKKYIAEVKTGKKATSIKAQGTRRQIIEYYYMTDCDGVLLVDMEEKQISEIDFIEDKLVKYRKNQKVLLIISIILGIINLALLFEIIFRNA